MTRPARIARNIAIGAVGFIILLAIVALIIIQTAWFRNTVREKIIAATEQATGGRVEVGAFGFDVSHLRATVTNFVIHGKEPANAAPFVGLCACCFHTSLPIIAIAAYASRGSLNRSLRTANSSHRACSGKS